MRYRLALLAVVALLACSSCSLAALSAIRAQSVNDPAIDLEQDLRPAPHSETADTVEKALPSVVHVEVVSVAGKGEGSGVIIDRSGVILTNAHVVEGSVSVRVSFNDGRSPVEGRVVGSLAVRDLAIIKVAEDDLEPITLGSSEQLRLGDEVIAIGYPLGLGGATVTRGIISGRARSIETDTPGGEHVRLEGLLQTDAAINPGNSGGALLDEAGRLVGINTAVAGFAENIGFAIAIDDALPTVEEILNEPPEEHAWLGVQTAPLDAATAGQLEVPIDTEGVAVVNVFEDTPATQAGIEEGDVIVSVAGKTITSPAALTAAITERDPGETVEIELLSAEGTRTVRVTLGARPVTLEVEEE